MAGLDAAAWFAAQSFGGGLRAAPVTPAYLAPEPVRTLGRAQRVYVQGGGWQWLCPVLVDGERVAWRPAQLCGDDAGEAVAEYIGYDPEEV